MQEGDIINYEGLALKYLEIMRQMRGRNAQKQVSDSMNGENFVLSYISEQKGNVIPSDISNAMGTSAARIAAALSSLEGKGLITRRIDPEDRRRILVDLTDSGREQVQEQNQMRISFITNMMEYLGEDDAREYLRIMKKLADRTAEYFK